MKPNKEGIWEWFDKDGTKRLVAVCLVGPTSRLRVYWWGGYYNVNNTLSNVPNDPFCKAEWPDSWGKYIGPHKCVPDSDLYLGPTEEQRKTIFSTDQ